MFKIAKNAEKTRSIYNIYLLSTKSLNRTNFYVKFRYLLFYYSILYVL